MSEISIATLTLSLLSITTLLLWVTQTEGEHRSNKIVQRGCNENTTTSTQRLIDVITISGSNVLCRITGQRSEALPLFTVVLLFCSAWFFYMRNLSGMTRERGNYPIDNVTEAITSIPSLTSSTLNHNLDTPSISLPSDSNLHLSLPILHDLEDAEKALPLIVSTSSKPPTIPTPLDISETNLIREGPHGTRVYKGSFQGRPVAVKRLRQDIVPLASHEISTLEQSDNHPNIIRCFYHESRLEYFYVALDLCLASLADIIKDPHRKEWRDIVQAFDARKAMGEVASGLGHLHRQKTAHRNIKPQNILISAFIGERGETEYRMLISDFGLSKKPGMRRTKSSRGWQAPEILLKLDELSTGTSSGGSVATIINGTPSSEESVDIFAFGCVIYYTLTNGGHPYGVRSERETNIREDNKQLSLLPQDELIEASDLITGMLDPEPDQRLGIQKCRLHPFFWDSAKRLRFLQDASDRFQTVGKKGGTLEKLEKDAVNLFEGDWHQQLDKIFIENMGKYREYDRNSVKDLLRLLRNKKHHFQDFSDDVKQHLGPTPEDFLRYFTRRFPRLFIHVYEVVKDMGLDCESTFNPYFKSP